MRKLGGVPVRIVANGAACFVVSVRLLLLLPAFASASTVPTCAAPSWHTVFVLDPSSGCPGEWEQKVALDGPRAPVPEMVCSRGLSGKAQVSAVVAEGWVYSQVRGTLTSYVMGSPDALRFEPLRGENSIDDAYLDGVALARWTASGRIHVASYAAGTSYSARHFSYYATTDCMCHGGAELPPDWLGDDYYCDSALRGGPTCDIGPEEPVSGGCHSMDECTERGCPNSFFILGCAPAHTKKPQGYLHAQGARKCGHNRLACLCARQHSTTGPPAPSSTRTLADT
eukprot:686551-Prymnesium_polylepis.1